MRKINLSRGTIEQPVLTRFSRRIKVSFSIRNCSSIDIAWATLTWAAWVDDVRIEGPDRSPSSGDDLREFIRALMRASRRTLTPSPRSPVFPRKRGRSQKRNRAFNLVSFREIVTSKTVSKIKDVQSLS